MIPAAHQMCNFSDKNYSLVFSLLVSCTGLSPGPRRTTVQAVECPGSEPVAEECGHLLPLLTAHAEPLQKMELGGLLIGFRSCGVAACIAHTNLIALKLS
jgi:hypothetical protein